MFQNDQVSNRSKENVADKEREYTFNNDIYSLAFATMIDPKKLDGQDGYNDYLEPI